MGAALDVRLTTPIYDPTFAARMLEMNAQRVRRWLFGYSFKYHPKKGIVMTHETKPLIRRDTVAGPHLVSFLDLIELFFAKAFLDRGVTLPRMRKALEEAQHLEGIHHPFARRQFFTAGKEIFLQLKEDDEHARPHLLHLLRGGQWAIADVVLQHARRLDFEPVTGEAVTWWPLGRFVPVIVDPRVGYGEPTIARKGVKTSVIYDMYKAEKKNVAAVAHWMRVDTQEVEAAVRWEGRLAATAA